MLELLPFGLQRFLPTLCIVTEILGECLRKLPIKMMRNMLILLLLIVATIASAMKRLSCSP